MKKILVFILAIVCAVCLTSCTETDIDAGTDAETSARDESRKQSAVSREDATEESVIEVFCNGKFDDRESINLVALGDSIARGYGLSHPQTQSYPYILSKGIEALLDGVKVNCTNYAVDGMKTDGLLKLLEYDAPKLSQADIVVISIGANNILGPFLKAVGALSYGGENAAQDTNALESFMEQLNGVIKSESFVSAMRSGIETAGKELPQIIKRIKTIAPGAIIMLSTVYSPYHGINLTLPYLKQSVMLGDESDKWVSLLNDEIRRTCSEEGCVLVESYDAFAESEGLVNASISLMPPRFSFDPHPNINGHIKLSSLHMSALRNIRE